MKVEGQDSGTMDFLPIQGGCHLGGLAELGDELIHDDDVADVDRDARVDMRAITRKVNVPTRSKQQQSSVYSILHLTILLAVLWPGDEGVCSCLIPLLLPPAGEVPVVMKEIVCCCEEEKKEKRSVRKRFGFAMTILMAGDDDDSRVRALFMGQETTWIWLAGILESLTFGICPF